MSTISPPITQDDLLALARNAIAWADQCWEGIEKAAGGKHYRPKADAFWKAWVEYWGARRPLTTADTDASTYKMAAALQPWNHRIPWNCPNFWDGCNCEGGPLYDPPPGVFPQKSDE